MTAAGAEIVEKELALVEAQSMLEQCRDKLVAAQHEVGACRQK